MISPSVPSPTRRGCPRCGAPLADRGNAGSDPGTALCGSCLLLAGIGEDLALPPASSAVDGIPPAEVAGPDGLGLQLGEHVLVRELGRGSMGVIYEARQPGTGRPVALKTINHGLLGDADVRTRFAREAEAAASLDHPHVLPIFEVGDDGGRPFFTMKLAEGGSLLRAMPRYAGRPREAAALMAKVARGIAHAHARGILHRDLKPGNILLDADGTTPLVADFGLARWLDRDSDLTQSLVVFGTPGYMAPEQARQAGQAGPGADVYSLGAILFQLLSGRTPFRGGNAIEVIEQARAGPAPALRELNPKAARDLETICARCLEFEPARRPGCAADLAGELERWLAGLPIRLRPVRLPERVWRWTARNPWLAGAAAGCVLLGGVAGTRHRESRRLDERLQAESKARATVAVLPLEDLGSFGAPSPVAARLSAALQRRLSAAPGLRCVPVSAPAGGDVSGLADWQLAGRTGRAPAVLCGSFRHRENAAGRTVGWRVVLRLVASSDGRVLARRVLDVPEDANLDQAVGDAAVQVAPEVTRAAGPAPAVGDFSEVTTHAEARDCLRVGQMLLSRQASKDLWRAAELFQKATELDPSCGVAHGWLAIAHAAQAFTEPGGGWSAKARGAAQASLRLDPWQPEAHRALGLAMLQEDEARQAREEILTAYEIEPAARNAQTLAWQAHTAGRPMEALWWLERAERRGPQPGAHAGFLAEILIDLGEDEAAATACRRAAEFRPGSMDGVLCVCRLWLLQGRFEQARAECHRLRMLDPVDAETRMVEAAVEMLDRKFAAATPLYRELVARDRSGGEDFSLGLGHLCTLGYLLRQAGEEAEGRAMLVAAREQALERLQRNPDHPRRRYAVAVANAALGESQAALDALAGAVEAGWTDFRLPNLDPRFDAVSREPRFQEILSRLAARMAALRRQRSADPVTSSNKPTNATSD